MGTRIHWIELFRVKRIIQVQTNTADTSNLINKGRRLEFHMKPIGK